MTTLNTKQLQEVLTGKNKAFITRVANQQEARYGNVDIFSATILEDRVEMDFGENWIIFFFDHSRKVYDTTGMGQGHRYHKAMQACAEELYQKFGGR